MLRYIFLAPKFFMHYNKSRYPEIEHKADRPHVLVAVKISSLHFGIPMRSNINHPHVFWTDKKNRCGIDYSKSVIIPDDTYIDSRIPHIRDNEHEVIKNNHYKIISGFEKYIQSYIKALDELHIDRKKLLCKYSTLQYFHKELGIDHNKNDDICSINRINC